MEQSSIDFGMSRRMFAGLAAGMVAGLLGGPRTARAAAKPIRLGHQADMTGFLAYAGYSFDRSLRAAVSAINARGGISGRPVEYVLEDTATDVSAGVRKFRKLVESDKVDFVIGSVHSGINLATIPVAKELKTITFYHGEAAETTGVKANRYGFRIRAHAASQAAAGVSYAVKNLGKKWAFILTDYAYGHSNLTEWAPLVQASGGEVVAKILVPVQTPDMLPYLAKVPAETQVLFSVFTAADGIRYFQQSYEIGLSRKLVRMGPGGMVDGVSLKPVERAVEGSYFLVQSPRWLDQVPKNILPYVSAARKAIGVNADGSEVGNPARDMMASYFLAPWHEAFILKRAIEEAKWESKDDNRKLIQHLEAFRGSASEEFPGGDFVLRAEDHQGFAALWIEQAKGAKLHVVAEIPKEAAMFAPRVDLRKAEF